MASSLLHGFSTLLFILSLLSLALSLNSDGLSLLALKAAITTDPTHFLDTWFDSDSTPCNWVGITCIRGGAVSAINLSGKNLTGYIPSELGALLSLRRLTLSHNNFSKPIPSTLFNATSLTSLDLSHNSLTGHIPDQIGALKTLSHLDLSSNSLNGSLPVALTELPQLSGTLNLSHNQFSGEVPPSFGRFRVTVSLDLRYNNLTGKIPLVGSLLNQGPTAFAGNPNLCGFPLRTPCSEAIPENPKTPNEENSSNNSSNSSQREKPIISTTSGRGGFVTVPILSVVSLVVAAVIISVWLLRKKWSSERGKMGEEKFREEEQEGQRGKFVVVEEGFGLELEDLLRASAYVVGKSRSGIVYKVVTGGRCAGGAGGAVVAVRRLSDGGAAWRLKEFEAEVDAIGRVQHPNIVRLRAYYYASDEKLLISDFVPNGCLYSALHGKLPLIFNYRNALGSP